MAFATPKRGGTGGAAGISQCGALIAYTRSIDRMPVALATCLKHWTHACSIGCMPVALAACL